MNTTRKALLNLLIPIITLSAIIFISNYQYKGYRKKINEEPVLVSGKVEEVKYYLKNGYVITYTFEVDYRHYNARMSGARFKSVSNIIKGKSFPVIYKKTEPDYNKMLILPEHFKEFDVAFPDSLSWIQKYIE